jgi:HSP20 family protein
MTSNADRNDPEEVPAMTEATAALNEVRDLYTKFLGQSVPEMGPGWYAPFPPGIDPVRFAIHEVEELKRYLGQMRIPEVPVMWVPRADVFAGKDSLVFRVEIPGVPQDQLKVLVAEGECIVRGSRVVPKDDRDLRPIGLEFPYGGFERRFTLPLHATTDKLVAKYADGILEVTIPIAEIAAPKEMKVEVA